MLKRVPKRRRRAPPRVQDNREAMFAPIAKKKPPFAFVLDELSAASPSTRPMFGCIAVYVEDKIVMVLRDRPTSPADNGVWIATTREHHASLKRDFPNMRSLTLFGSSGTGVTGWQILAADNEDFEESVMLACERIVAGDVRIGKIPAIRKRPARATAKKRAGR